MKITRQSFPKKNVLCSDLHNTIIETFTGSMFPRGIWDMDFMFDTLDAIKNYGFRILFIFSNQGDIEFGYLDEQHFRIKMDYIKCSLMEYLRIPVEYDYYKFNNPQSRYRKPNPGMLENFYDKTLPAHNITASKQEILMIGDASGNEDSWSDIDLMTANNFGIDYMDVDVFTERFGNKF